MSSPIQAQFNRHRSRWTGDDVLRQMDRHMVRGLFQYGGFVRRTVMRSMRPASKNPRSEAYTSRPGQPPRAHTKRLRRGLRFAVERDVPNVLIGPIRKNAAIADVPKRLEEGGSHRRRLIVIDEDGNSYPAADAPHIARPMFRPADGVPAVTVRIQPRPYMQPGFEVGNQNLERFFGMRV